MQITSFAKHNLKVFEWGIWTFYAQLKEKKKKKKKEKENCFKEHLKVWLQLGGKAMLPRQTVSLCLSWLHMESKLETSSFASKAQCC